MPNIHLTRIYLIHSKSRTVKRKLQAYLNYGNPTVSDIRYQVPGPDEPLD